ncbi:MAG TPA: DUF5615 family PIN-like protein [Chitinophagales bacterium]|nr:DUF5615 family PIN-like protein [Chitinophagales bacterium]
MMFLFDENVPYNLVNGLSFIEAVNYKSKFQSTVSHPKNHSTESASDEEIIKLASRLKAIIITFDKDFKHLKKYATLYKNYKLGIVF